VGIGAFIHRRAAPDVYVDRGYGATATYTRNIGVRDKASLNYRFEITRVEATDVYFCVNYGVCDTTTINVLRSHQRLNPLLTSYLRDRSNETFTPTTGHVIRAEAEHASALTASAYRYNRVFGDAAYYFRVRPSRAKGWASSSVSPAITNTVLAVHLRVGLVRPLASGSIDSVLHPRKRFYAGGAQSVRGYGENQLGPRILTVDPRRLAGATSVDGGVCNWQTLDIRFCDPNSTHADTSGDTALQDKFFFARPLGGTSLVEGSVELRFPIWKKITGAAFVDAATVGEAAVTSFTQLADLDALKKGAWAVTPGIGVRYHTRVGPIRVDIGYNPARVEQLPVATQVTIDGQERIVPLVMPRHYDPTQSWYQRMTLHLSIGQAY